MLSQAFGVDAVGAGVAAGIRGSYLHLGSRAGGTEDDQGHPLCISRQRGNCYRFLLDVVF
jgi:hypothetical protein